MKHRINLCAGRVLLTLGVLLSFALWNLQLHLPTVLAAGTWTGKQGMPTARLGAGGDVINGLFYVAGGDKGNLNFTAALEVYNPANNTWATKKDMPTARRYFGAAAIDGKLYTVGGGRSYGTYYNNLEVYDPVKDEWVTKKAAPTARHLVSAAAIDGKLYVTGGNDDRTSKTNLEVYDPTKDEWTSKKPLPTARSEAAAAVIGGKLYVVGGLVFTFPAATFLNTLEVYDPATDTWESKTGMPTARSSCAAVAIDGKLYVVGGSNNAIQGNGLSTLEVYDPATDTWKSDMGMPTGRQALAAAVSNGKIYAAGGTVNTFSAFGTLEVYEPPPPNTIPMITAVSITRTAGSTAGMAKIATVSDAEDDETALNVTPTPVSGSGVTLSKISTDTSGNVTADVATTCSATTSTFTLQVTDSGTLSATTTLTVTVKPDATPPDTSLVGTPLSTADGNATFSFTGMDNCSSTVTFECQLDGGGFNDCTNPQMYTNLAGGTHTFEVRAKDALGNVDATPATYTWTVFTSSCSTAVNPILLPAATRGTPFVQTLSAAPTGSYVFSLLSGTLPPGINLVNTLGIYSLRGTPTTAGEYRFTIRAKKNNSTCEGARTYTIVVP